MNDVSIWELIARVFAAAIVGAAIGYEREIKNKPAGFYTFTLVCIGSCLIAILQLNLAQSAIITVTNNPSLTDVIKVDEGRIIAQVVSGIGFLGAGTIIHNRGNVKGITTAALLWLVAALGLMIGVGGVRNYILAAVTVGIVLPIASIARGLSEKLSKSRKIHRMHVVFDDSFEKNLYDAFASQGILVKKTYLMNKSIVDGIHLKDTYIYICLPKNKSFDDMMNYISDLDFVTNIEEA